MRQRTEKNQMREKIKQWVNGLSVKKKLIFYGYLTISPVMIFISLVLLFVNYDKAKDEWMDSNLNSVNALSESLNSMQMEIKDFSTYLCINTQVKNLLTDDNPEERNKNARVWEEETPIQYVQDVLALKGYIKTFAIYSENGIRPYLRGMDGSVHIADMEDIYRTEIYSDTVNSKYGYIWRSIPKGRSEVYTTNREDKIVLCREMFDQAKKRSLGYIVISISQESYENLIKNAVQDENEGVLVLGADGEELSRAGFIDPEVEEKLKSPEFVIQDYRVRENCFTYKKYDIICRQAGENTSIVCKIVPVYGVWQQVQESVYTSVMLLLGVLAGMLPLFLIISNLVTRPLQRVSDAIRKFSAGDFEQKVEVSTRDEVGEVAACFNYMVEDIKHLIEENYVITLRERESELAILQAQINPHFLYNTLDSLYWQAMEAGNEELAESILALSQLFRMVLSQGKSEIPVEHEMELVSCYLQIQKMRFAKRLDYQIEVEPAIQKAKIPKLIIQPFVENAIVHGFEKADGKCELTVRAWQDAGFVKFEIKDTGTGMSKEQIEAVWKEEPAHYAKHRVGRYAIRNIRERLQLKYQQRFQLEIQSVIGEGTTVTISIPFEACDLREEKKGEAVNRRG